MGCHSLGFVLAGLIENPWHESAENSRNLALEERKKQESAHLNTTNPRWIADDGENIVAMAGR